MSHVLQQRTERVRYMRRSTSVVCSAVETSIRLYSIIILVQRLKRSRCPVQRECNREGAKESPARQVVVLCE